MAKEKRLEEEIIFQVKLNRITGEYELIKKPLSNLEQSGLQVFLENYVTVLKKIGIEEIENDYLERIEVED